MAKTKIVPTNIREVLSHSMKQFNHEMQLQKAIETSVALKLKINELERKRKEIDQKSKQEEEENTELEEESTRGPPGSDQPTEHVVEKETCPTKTESVTEKTSEVASLNKERGKPRRDKSAGGGFPNVCRLHQLGLLAGGKQTLCRLSEFPLLRRGSFNFIAQNSSKEEICKYCKYFPRRLVLQQTGLCTGEGAKPRPRRGG